MAVELVPFRDADHAAARVADLERELELTRRELRRARVRLGEELPVYDDGAPCRKCGASMGNVNTAYVAAVTARWWRRGEPERMRRKCLACGAVWHESPLDAARTEAT